MVFALARRLARAPALHFAVFGGLLYGASAWREPARSMERLVIPAYRVQAALDDYQALSDRPLTPEQRRQVTEFVVDQEVLLAYARQIGLDRDPVVERRLALIGGFVAENPDEAKSAGERAGEAAVLGLGEGDLVVRRILIDSAKRLIRAAVRVREPSEPALAAYLAAHTDEFRRPGQWRLSQVAVETLRHRGAAERVALDLLDRLRRGAVPPDAAARWGDRGFVESRLPALSARELERRFGRRFVESLDGLPEGSWQGPVPSRYGLHLVWIEQRLPGRVPGLDEVRGEVRARLREDWAEQWLAQRLRQLRAGFAVEVAATGPQGEPS